MPGIAAYLRAAGHIETIRQDMSIQYRIVMFPQEPLL